MKGTINLKTSLPGCSTHIQYFPFRMIHHISSTNEFQKKITRGFVVVDFYATWCGPCKAIEPRFEQLSKQYPHVTFIKVNVDQGDVAQQYQVTAMPTFLFFSQGQKVHSIVGADIQAVEDYIRSNGKVHGSFQGKGNTLSGTKNTTGTTASTGQSIDSFLLIGLVCLFGYLYYTK
jgi:thioredoxin 1